MIRHCIAALLVPIAFVLALGYAPAADAAAPLLMKKGGRTQWKETDAKKDVGKFGGGYDTGGQVAVWQSGVGQAKAWANVEVMVFGLREKIVDIHAKAVSKNQQAYAEGGIAFMGIDLWNPQMAASISADKRFSRDFFEHEQRFMAGPVPLKLSASAGGELGINVTATAATDGVALSATPEAGAVASVGLGVDVLIAEITFSVNLSLVNVAVPVVAVLDILGFDSFDWSITADLVLTFLSGSISFDWEVFKGRWSGTKILYEWEGIVKSFQLLHASSANGGKRRTWAVQKEGESTTVAVETETTLSDVGMALLLKNMRTGRCLDGGNLAQGTLITSKTCSGSDAQYWYFDDDGRIRSDLENTGSVATCLDGGDPNRRLQTWMCHGNANQQWELLEDGRLRNVMYPDRCIDAQNGLEGNVVMLTNCGGATSQQFDVAVPTIVTPTARTNMYAFRATSWNTPHDAEYIGCYAPSFEQWNGAPVQIGGNFTAGWPGHFVPDAAVTVKRPGDANRYTYMWDGYYLTIVARTPSGGTYIEGGWERHIQNVIPNWPVFWGQIDAATVIDKYNAMYLFRGDEYLKIDVATMAIQPGYPKKIAGNFSESWPEGWGDGVDAAVNAGNGYIYFMRGNQYAAYSIEGWDVPFVFDGGFGCNWVGTTDAMTSW